jgi:hypothetical protein
MVGEIADRNIKKKGSVGALPKGSKISHVTFVPYCSCCFMRGDLCWSIMRGDLEIMGGNLEIWSKIWRPHEFIE